jgi:hypothetical protein
LNALCTFNDGPSAYQSTSNLMIYPQTTFPFEISGLLFPVAEATFPNET